MLSAFSGRNRGQESSALAELGVDMPPRTAATRLAVVVAIAGEAWTYRPAEHDGIGCWHIGDAGVRCLSTQQLVEHAYDLGRQREIERAQGVLGRPGERDGDHG